MLPYPGQSIRLRWMHQSRGKLLRLPLGSSFLSTSPIQLTNELLQLKVADPHPYWRKIEQKNPIPPRESHVALPLTARHLLIYGGTTPSETMLDDYWLCDLETATWQQVIDIRGNL